MRTLFDLHYDEMHFAAWNEKQKKKNSEKRVPLRKDPYKEFRAAREMHRQKLNEQVEPPRSVRLGSRCSRVLLHSMSSNRYVLLEGYTNPLGHDNVEQ